MINNILTDKDLASTEKVILLYLFNKSNNTKIDITLKIWL